MLFETLIAPEYFKKQMTKSLARLKGMVCVMDQIMVIGNNLEKQDEKLKKHLES